MSYVDLVNRFWRMDSQEPFTSVETRLYFFLLNTANRSGWGKPFPLSNAALAMSLGCSPNTMDKARSRLCARGLLIIEPGGFRGCRTSRYTIVEPGSRKSANPSGTRSENHSKIHSEKYSNFETFDETCSEIHSKTHSNFEPFTHIDIDSSYRLKTKDLSLSLKKSERATDFFDECCAYFLAPERGMFQEAQQRLYGITDLAGAFGKFRDTLVAEDLLGEIRSHQDFARLFKFKYCIPLYRSNETSTGNNSAVGKEARDASFRAHIVDKLTRGGSG